MCAKGKKLYMKGDDHLTFCYNVTHVTIWKVRRVKYIRNASSNTVFNVGVGKLFGKKVE